MTKSEYNPSEIAHKTQILLLEDRENMLYYIEVLKQFKDGVKPNEMYDHLKESISVGNRDF
jgi:hypothetical protein